MAKTTVWTGAASGDLNVAGNWTNGVPVATDTIIFNGTGPADVTANADAFTSLLMAKVVVERGYTGSLGTSGTPLELSATVFTYYGTGKLYFKNGDTSDTADLILNAPGASMMQIGCNTAGITRIAALKGDVTLTSTLTGTTDLFVGRNAKVNIEGSNAITNVIIDKGGVVTNLVPITDLDMLGGQFTQFLTGGAVTTIHLGGDARATWMASATVGTAIVGTGCVLDYSRDAQAKTLDTARVFEGGVIIPNDELTITNGGSLVSVSRID